jgi:protein-S-isoprenylcysteine O-methyltransferase Ste14
MIGWTVFGVASAALLIFSRKSLLKPRSHGFYRFFAWEAILGAFSLNINVWFGDPFSWNQIISWILLCCSVPVVVSGTLELKRTGRPDTRRQDESLIGFEKTTKLVTTGIYRHIRHPLYCSLLLLAWGVVFKNPGWFTLSLGLTVSFFLVKTARTDEAECLNYFGEEYREYMSRSKMFIPYLF